MNRAPIPTWSVIIHPPARTAQVAKTLATTFTQRRRGDRSATTSEINPSTMMVNMMIAAAIASDSMSSTLRRQKN
jgi:hypothetical protein